ncbi:phosphoribosylaminoimidazolesuccinocarboxamide synthase [Bifidobacterium phasiani]|uniref:Phosphoribosylaminoimidazole-succinocarboxamide synthase n=1 Tax=Bifidobacterium phasiani TaxID=2834431 RepID=A0ABS6W7G2_9BIFI|nr:phosphoribosylaminoimidazolesuccinocarboxamide synthase [Bifidobacterium phasiani]MBW3082434.1 phosphoribosylaminoimidazolesuccinocarboxamide synthase [Bifidobacterium phasiani]
MEKLEKLYEGKAKKLYATDDPDVLWVEYMNQATAGNGEKKAQIEGKGALNNRITAVVFDLLRARGVDSHFVRRISETEQLVRKMNMYPLEIIMRNTAAGSFAKRYGVEEGTELNKPILEFCLKSDELGDPFINEDGIVALGLADEDEVAEISRQARAVNAALTDIFARIDVRLVDFKIEEGRTSDGAILLADEITPDTCRLWDLKDRSGRIEHLDKDLFRRDLGNIIPAYEEIHDRLTALAKAEGLDEAE